VCTEVRRKMRIIPKFFWCNQKARFLILFLVYSIFFRLNFGLWATVLDLLLASSFFPFLGYLILIFGRQYLKVLYYATKKGEINAELTSIAKKENPRISKVVVKDIDCKSAYANSVTNSIILTRKLLDTLTHKETLAVLYHEIGHGGFYSLPIRILRLVFIIPAFLILYLVSCFFVYGVINFLLAFFWNPFSLVFAPSVLFCILNIIEERRIAWSLEYKADARASSKIGMETMISALKKTLSPEFEYCDSPTHPSLKRRIDHLRMLQKDQDKTLKNGGFARDVVRALLQCVHVKNSHP